MVASGRAAILGDMSIATPPPATVFRSLRPPPVGRRRDDGTRLSQAWAVHPALEPWVDPTTRRMAGWIAEAKFDVEPAVWAGLVRDHLDQCGRPHQCTMGDALVTVLLAASCERWAKVCDDDQMRQLQSHFGAAMDWGGEDEADASATRILLAAELPITLAATGWIDNQRAVAGVKFLRRMCGCEGFETSLLQRRPEIRHAAGSLMRCRDLSPSAAGKKIGKDVLISLDWLAGWVLALCDRDGSMVAVGHRPERTPGDAPEAASSEESNGGSMGEATGEMPWLRRLADVDPESYGPAIDAATGDKPRRTLAWEVSLPQSVWIDPDAAIAVMMPAWDRRRGRMEIDFARATMDITIHTARRKLIDGPLRTETTVDGQTLSPETSWEMLCDYTDDDVHYLELEQQLTGGVRLQRQLMVLRESQAAMIGDSVLVPEKSEGLPTDDGPAIIQHRVGLPYVDDLQPRDAPETREVFLDRSRSSKADRPAAMLIPVAGGEWRIGPTMATLQTDASGQQLVWQSFGGQRLYTPLWIDLRRSRFDRPRTWRRLTVGEELSIVPDHVASAFRVQFGSEQWMLYRSLVAGRLRTVLGKHLMHDFFASRFDPGDGVHEELVTVDE